MTTTELRGSWVVISRVVSPPNMGYSYSYLLIAPLIATHEPPSRGDIHVADELMLPSLPKASPSRWPEAKGLHRP